MVPKIPPGGHSSPPVALPLRAAEMPELCTQTRAVAGVLPESDPSVPSPMLGAPEAVLRGPLQCTPCPAAPGGLGQCGVLAGNERQRRDE